MLLAHSINPSAPTLFHAPLSPHAKSYKPPKVNPGRHDHTSSLCSVISDLEKYDTSPAKLIWTLTPQIHVGIRFAETRLSDLICQNDCQALEFKGYGKNFITSHGFSPDAFVQMAFQAAYFGLYGKLSLHGVLRRPVTELIDIREDRVYIRACDDESVFAWSDRSDPDRPAGECRVHEGQCFHFPRSFGYLIPFKRFFRHFSQRLPTSKRLLPCAKHAIVTWL